MKLFGHPIHMMLVHFPSALFPADVAFAAIYYFTKTPSFNDASFYAMCGGVVMGWLAIVFGAFDLISVSKSKPAAMNKALLHGGINTVVVLIYTVLAYLQYKQYPAPTTGSAWMLTTKALTVTCMIVGNFIGGSLVLKYKVAVDDDSNKTV